MCSYVSQYFSVFLSPSKKRKKKLYASTVKFRTLSLNNEALPFRKTELFVSPVFLPFKLKIIIIFFLKKRNGEN